MRIHIGDLIKSFGGWIPGHKKPEPAADVDSELNPVLLVPGIGGSILNAVHEDGSVERVWVRLFGADAEFREKLYSAFDPTTGKTVSLNEKVRIEVPQDQHGIYSCDILDPDVIIRMNVVYYFHDLIERMLSWGYEQVFGFGYDFRQSNRLAEVMEAFEKKLETIYEHSGGKKVKIVTHSMGGLLVKCFLALHKDAFEKYVDTWIAITAPWQGAPGFVTDCLLTGVEFVKGWQRELFIAKWSTHQLLIECPSIYELMTSHDFKWKKAPELHVWRKNENESESELASSEGKAIWKEIHNPHSGLNVMRDALNENLLHYRGTALPCPFNEAIFEWSKETRNIMKRAKLPRGVLFYNIYGTSQETPFDVSYGTPESPIGNLSEILKTEASFTCVDGDGTVPVESGKADFLDAAGRVGIPGDHRGILLDERLFRIVKHWLKAGVFDPFYDPFNDYVILPTRSEFEEYKKLHLKIESEKHHHEAAGPDHELDQDEYIAAVISGSTRAEAHSTVNHKDDDPDDVLQVSTYGVAEGADPQARCHALEEAMVAASEKAIAASSQSIICA